MAAHMTPLRSSLVGLCVVGAALAALVPPNAGSTGPTESPTAVDSPVRVVAEVKARHHIHVRWRARVVARGERIVARGRVPHRHRRVVLQVRRAGRWVVSDRAATNGRRFRVEVRAPRRAGRFTYRLVSPVTRAQRRHGLRRALSEPTTILVGSARTRGPEALGDPADFTHITTANARWNPCETITYRVNPTYGPATALRDVAGAVKRVEEATGLDLAYAGTTEVVPQANSGEGYPKDTQIVIAWAGRSQSPMITGDGVAGVGGPIGWHGNVEEDGTPVLTWSRGTVVLNSAFNRLDPGFGTGATMGRLVMHELGHVVGLGHAVTGSQVMFPTLREGYPGAWGAGDRAGLAGLGAEQGCILPRDSAAPSARRRGGVAVVSPVTVDTLGDVAGEAAVTRSVG